MIRMERYDADRNTTPKCTKPVPKLRSSSLHSQPFNNANYTFDSIDLQQSTRSRHSNHSSRTNLLSNSSFSHLDMYKQVLSLSANPSGRVRVPSNSSSETDDSLESEFMLGKVRRFEPGSRRVGEVSTRPALSQRRLGASLQTGVEELVDRPAPPTLVNTIIQGPEQPMVLGSSTQRARRLAARCRKQEAEVKAREAHLADALSAFDLESDPANSPDTIDSVELITPSLTEASLIPDTLVPSKSREANDRATGLGLGFIGIQPLQPPAADSAPSLPIPLPHLSSSPKAEWPFHLPVRSQTIDGPPRSASSHSSGPRTASPRASSAGATSGYSLSSYYFGSRQGTRQGERDLQREAGSRERSQTPEYEKSPFAFEVPAAAREEASTPRPEIDSPTSSSASTARPTSSGTPHRIKRKAVPPMSPEDMRALQDEEWRLKTTTGAVERTSEETRASDEDYPRSAIPLCRLPVTLFPDAGAEAEPVPGVKSPRLHFVAQAFKSVTRLPFGRSVTSIDTEESSDIRTPDDSFEFISEIEVREVTRDMTLMQQKETIAQGYMSTGQRIEAAKRTGLSSAGAEASRGAGGEKKGIRNPFKKFTLHQG